MARPERRDVDYFPFYIKEGKTLSILDGKYGCKGLGFFTHLLRLFSRTPNHHIQIEKASDMMYFFVTTRCDEESGLDMINVMVETGKLDRDLWEQKKVLASKDYLDSIQDAYKKRNNDCITIEEIKLFYGVSVHGNIECEGLPDTETPPSTQLSVVSGGDNPQRKEKKRKEKKIRDDIYNEYIFKINPLRKSKQRAVSNIKFHLKKHTHDDIVKSILNYQSTITNTDSQFRKDPANFFGKSELYFKDYLPGVFDPKESVAYQNTGMQNIPAVLTPERLAELNA